MPSPTSLALGFVAVCFCITMEVNALCIYNEIPTDAFVETRENKLTRKIIRESEKICCNWENDECFMSRKLPRETGSQATMAISCSRDNNGVITYVEVFRGGKAKILPSPTGADNFVDVYNHLGQLKYWYRCGTLGEWHAY